MAKNLKYFRKLKTLMFDKEVDQTYIAEKAGKSIGYISNRFQGKQPFSMDDVYTIIEILEIPQEEALTYFPKGGISERSKRGMNISDLLKEYLHQEKNNVFCYAGDYLMNTPKKGYDREFFEAKERVELLEDLLERIKEETV